MTDTYPDEDEAARRTAVNLMRLLEAVEMREAEGRPARSFLHRIALLRNFYKGWFTRVGTKIR